MTEMVIDICQIRASMQANRYYHVRSTLNSGVKASRKPDKFTSFFACIFKQHFISLKKFCTCIWSQGVYSVKLLTHELFCFSKQFLFCRSLSLTLTSYQKETRSLVSWSRNIHSCTYGSLWRWVVGAAVDSFLGECSPVAQLWKDLCSSFFSWSTTNRGKRRILSSF